MNYFESIRQDVSYALRAMRRTPVMTAAAILSLGLGIGANAAIFSLIDTIMLRYLPVRSPQELVQFAWRQGQKFVPTQVSSIRATGRGRHEFDGQQKREPSVFATPSTISFAITRHDSLWRRRAQSEYGIRPSLLLPTAAPKLRRQNKSREISSMSWASSLPRAASSPISTIAKALEPSAVLSHAYWLRRFGGDSSIVGQSISVNGTSFTVLGVVSAGFEGVEVGSGVDIYVPLSACSRCSAINAGIRVNKVQNLRHARRIWWIKGITARRRQEAFRHCCKSAVKARRCSASR